MTQKVLDEQKVLQQANIIENVQPEAPLPAAADVPVPPTTTEPPSIRCGYVIAVRTDGEMSFELIGQSVTIAELLGLNKLATERIQSIADTQLEGPQAAFGKKLDQILQRLEKLGKHYPNAGAL